MLDISSQKRLESSLAALRCIPRCAREFVVPLSVVCTLLMLTTTVPALNLIPIDTTGFDQDIVFEAGLTDGQVGANGELGSRQFFEAGVFADGLPQSITGFTNPLTGNTIDFNFAPFEGNNILKFDNTAANSVPKTLTLAAPNKYGQLAIVHSGGSMAINPLEVALLGYTINYVGGATQTGTVNSVDWGAVPQASMPAGTEILFSADRTTANATAWPVVSDNNTTARRWNVYVSEIPTDQPSVNIQSVTFGPVSLNNPGTPLNAGDDVVVFGLAGSGNALLLGDTDGDGTVEFDDDFGPIRDNFRKQVGARSEGDLVRNGVVDFDDFRQWKTAFVGAGGSLAGLDLSFGSVPEPSAAALALGAILGACSFRRRK
jgi:hypothetical protein